MRKLEEKNLIVGKIINSPQSYGDKMVATVSSKYGEGTFVSYQVMNGVDITYNDFKTYRPFRKEMKVDYKKNVIIMNYCAEGKFKYEFTDNREDYICDGDLCFWGCENTVKSVDFSQKRYKGITIIFTLNKLESSIVQMLGTPQINIHMVANKIFDTNTCFVTTPNDEITNVLGKLYSLPKEYTIDYLKVKTIELLILMCLNYTNFEYRDRNHYTKSFIEKIEKIKDIIEERYDEHITIEELAKMINTNTTYLKKGFKYVYGNTINLYRKKYRMHIAEELLKNTDYKIIDIATEIGYSSPSKFTRAFKDVFSMTPTIYRKTYNKFSE
jgi:AraC-like DNA-binding protein